MQSMLFISNACSSPIYISLYLSFLLGNCFITFYSALSGYSQLIVNGKIYVRKDNVTGKLDIEGPLCEDFYNVRSVVTGQFVTLTT